MFIIYRIGENQSLVEFFIIHYKFNITDYYVHKDRKNNFKMYKCSKLS